MEIVHSNESYKDGGSELVWRDGFDFVLFRQDFDGAEHVYFNENEVQEILLRIGNCEIPIHPNYSILLAKDGALLSKYGEEFPCFGLTQKEYARGK